MMGFLRFLCGLLLLPACWGAVMVLLGLLAAAGGLNACALSLLGGIVFFVFCWMALPHPVKTYVLGHELTHALWGLLFGAIPSRLRVRATGGSVNLTKCNLLITLAPYFFPFYTFIVLLAAGVTACFVRPIPYLPVWMFLIGLTWAFHVLFTVESLAQTQPDVTLYGRVFSWAFILLANLLVVLLFLTLACDFRLSAVGASLCREIADDYVACARLAREAFSRIAHLLSSR